MGVDHEASGAGPNELEGAGPDEDPGPSGRTEEEAAVDHGSDQDQAEAGGDDELRRALADLDNLRKRFLREVGRERAAERADVAARWLPVVDNLERALAHAVAEEPALTEGLLAVRDQAVGVLESLGFPRYEDAGVPFDPIRHEAMSAVTSDEPKGTVLTAVVPGYGRDEVILRPAGVVVSTGP